MNVKASYHSIISEKYAIKYFNFYNIILDFLMKYMDIATDSTNEYK